MFPEQLLSRNGAALLSHLSCCCYRPILTHLTEQRDGSCLKIIIASVINCQTGHRAL